MILLINRTLRRGDRGYDVKTLQERLITLGFLSAPSDSGFGPLVEGAIKNFQSRNGLKADGVVGKQTLSALSQDAPKPDDVVVATPRTPAQYAAKYRAAKIRPDKLSTVRSRAALLLKYKDSHYAPVALKCLGSSDLWWVVACIHNQESGSDVGKFMGVLHNGEKIVGTGKKTSLVPAGRGPFATWNEAAIDALYHDGANKRKSWDIGSALEFFERYNGLGYRGHGVASPYVWSMTDQYVKGHYGERVYIINGKKKPKSTWYPEKVSQNYGVASIMMALGISG